MLASEAYKIARDANLPGYIDVISVIKAAAQKGEYEAYIIVEMSEAKDILGRLGSDGYRMTEMLKSVTSIQCKIYWS